MGELCLTPGVQWAIFSFAAPLIQAPPVMSRLLTLSAILVTCTLRIPAQASDPDTQLWDRLLAGEIVSRTVESESGHRGGQTQFLITAPREDIWQALNDYHNFVDIFDGVDSVAVLRRDSTGVELEVFTEHVLFKQFRYVLKRIIEEEGRRLSWTQQSGEMLVNEGSWEIRDTDEPGTHLLVHHSFVKLNHVLPETFTAHFTQKKMALSDAKLREWLARPEAVLTDDEGVDTEGQTTR